MFGTTVDTIIGLVLVFLLFSTLLTTLTEMLAGVLKLRAKALEGAIIRLLGDGASALARTVMTHPLVGGSASNGKPSYVPAQNFSTALLHALSALTPMTIGDLTDLTALKEAIGTLPPGPRAALEAVVDQAVAQATSAEQYGLLIKAGMETWFDGAMDRLSGDYKRYTQVITLVIGVIAAVAFNVDAIRITQRLYAEPALRTTLESAARTAVEHPTPADKPKDAPATKGGASPAPANSAASTAAPASTDAPTATPATDGGATLTSLEAQLKAAQTAEGALAKVGPVGWGGGPPLDAGAFALAVLGWILTALAGMLGAPFWFDTLNSLMNLRNAGSKPPSSTSPQS